MPDSLHVSVSILVLSKLLKYALVPAQYPCSPSSVLAPIISSSYPFGLTGEFKLERKVIS